ncbi:MAG: MaoC family dehydratase [Chloroflexi bacterium]|nr:MaoC family dehydratase [Chloroflexota bacterium]
MTEASTRSRTAAREAAQPFLNHWGPYTLTRDAVTPELIWRFCEVAEDANPVYWDEAAATRSRFGRLVAPPQMIRSFAFAPWWSPEAVRGRIRAESDALSAGDAPPAVASGAMAIVTGLGYTVATVGSADAEYLEPYGPGDGRITSRSMTVDVSEEKQTRPGRGVFVTSVTEYRTEVGDRLIARTTMTTLMYDPTTPRPSA